MTTSPQAVRRRYAIHGHAAELTCAVPSLQGEIDRVLAYFEVPGWPDGMTPADGYVRPFTSGEVLKHLSPRARKVGRPDAELHEIYEDGERFWVIDDRWGMAEVNLLKSQWRSWILPTPRADAARCVEMAVLWPMSQVLRAKGLSLVPAPSAVVGGRGVLFVSAVGLGPELKALAERGNDLVAQRWTAVREEEGRFALLHVPGRVERAFQPRLSRDSGLLARDPADAWANLAAEVGVAERNHAFCDAVVIIPPGRRPRSAVRAVDVRAAAQTLRACWPITELHPQRRQGRLAGSVGHRCPCFEMTASHDPADFVRVLTRTLATDAAGYRATDASSLRRLAV